MAANGSSDDLDALRRRADGLHILRQVDPELDAELKAKRSFVTLNVFNEAMKQAGVGIAGHVAKLLGIRDSKLAAIEARLAELERRPELKYSGTWLPERGAGQAYEAGELVTDRGALWLCTRTAVRVRPGETDHWRLIVKKGGAVSNDV